MARLSLRRIQQFAEQIFQPALRNVEYLQRRLIAIASIAIIMFPLYYFIWHELFPQPYENLWLRLLGSALFIPIMFSNRLPSSIAKFIPYYWYFALLYAFPFFFTFMLLKNNASEVWVTSTLVAIFLMILLYDWITLLIQIFVGAGFAVLAFSLTSDASIPIFERYDYLAIIVFAIVCGVISSYDNERVRIEQERAMLATASSIAHELRTPLLSIRAGATGVRNYLPDLIASYHLAREHELPVPFIRSIHLNSMQGIMERLDNEARHANSIIDMLLVDVRVTTKNSPASEPHSIAKCIETALERYPFSSHERALVTWDKNQDFMFKGIEILVIHVLFNLIKNALRHISQASKGTISISLECSRTSNRLIFRDTGSGIPAEARSHIFTRFYTTATDSAVGTGIGLAFCRDVMRSFGGTIHCNSEHGHFCEFILTFPPV